MKLKRQVFSYPYIVWMLIFILVPMLLIVLFAFRSDEGLTLGNITSVLSNEIYMEVLGRSIWIALKATAICLILGYPIAYILSTMNKRKAAILYVLFIVPMWMNFLLRTYAWQVLLDSNGVLNTLLELLGLPSQQILYTEGAVMLGTVYNFLPFMVLPIYSVLVKLDRSLVEAAADLGANPITCFIKVVLPQSVPGIISGITMVFIPAITTFAISRLLGGGKFLLYGDLIENQFITLGQSAWPVGSALSFILLILVLLSMAVVRSVIPAMKEVCSGEKAQKLFSRHLPWANADIPVRSHPCADGVFLQRQQVHGALDRLLLQMVRGADARLHHYERPHRYPLCRRDIRACGHLHRHLRRNRHTFHEEAAEGCGGEYITPSNGQPGPGHRYQLHDALCGNEHKGQLYEDAHSPHHLQYPLCDILRDAQAAPKLQSALRSCHGPWLHPHNGHTQGSYTRHNARHSIRLRSGLHPEP